jgi:hypothetical protein
MDVFTGLPSDIDTLEDLSDEITRRNLLDALKNLEEDQAPLRKSIKEVLKYYSSVSDWKKFENL